MQRRSFYQRGRRHAQAAFTLVELLVVIAIISILAGLLLPALGKAIEKAHGIADMNHMRQIHMASLSYADAYNGALLMHKGLERLYELRYVTDHSVYGCPDDPYFHEHKNPVSSFFSAGVAYSYGPNLCTINPFLYGTAPQHLPIKLSDVRGSGKIWYAECRQIQGSPYSDNDGVDYQSPSKMYVLGTDCNYQPTYRHGGGSHTAAFDGHVSWRSKADLLNFPDWKFWQP